MGGPETLLFYLILLLLGAKVGGEIAGRLKQPPVVGELLVGILLGPSVLRLIPPFELLDSAKEFFHDASTGHFVSSDFGTVQSLGVLAALAQLGVLILLFEVGLESNLREFARVGLSAGLVGTYGVVFSLGAGAVASYLFAQRFDWVITPTALAQPHLLHVFVGATLAATSIGITARVLGDLGKIRTREAQIILGGAVLDDVLGLIVLAIVSGLVVDPSVLTPLGVSKVFAVALGFFFVAIAGGVFLGRRLIDAVHKNFRTPYVHVGFGFIFMLFVSYLATLVGLAAIVGAFAAGLALSTSTHRHVIFDHLKPVGSLFVGFFFVVLGTRVDLTQATRATLPLILLVAGVLTVAGTIAKLGAGWGVVRTKASKYVVGVGMVPRGEVGLIFAVFGLEHRLITNWQYSAIIIVVLLTTLITPFWLKAVAGRFGEPLPEPPGQARLGEVTPP